MTVPMFVVEQEVATSDDYYTPSWIFEALDIEFDLDVAAPPGGVAWIPAKRYYTKADDGLSQPWEGKVWCNPPYSKATPWVEKMIDHRNGFLLLPLVVSNWLDRICLHSDSIVLLPRDMQFARPGRKDGRIMFRTALFGFGEWAREPLERIGHVR